MPNATARRLQLVAVLQARPGVTAGNLAERFATTERTIRRDIAGLRELGYRIEAVPGRAGGYTLGTGSARPPLALDDAEAVAVALGLRMLAEAGVRDVDDAAATAIAKLEQTLPSRVRARWAAIGSATSSARRRTTLVDADVLAMCAVACRSREALRIRHRRPASTPRGRDVQPYRVVHLAGRWYLVAYAVAVADWRVYRLDRIVDVRHLAVRFPTPPPPGDPVAFVTERLGAGAWPVHAVVRLPMDLESATTVVPPTLGTLVADGDDTTLLRIGSDDLGWVARQLARLELDFDVIAPPELSTALHDLGTALVERFGTSAAPP